MLWFVALPLTTLAGDHGAGLHRADLRHHRRGAVPAEDVRLRRWIAVLVGFAGAMIIIRPGFGEIHLGVICILITTPIFSASNLISKALARTDSADHHRDLAEHRDRGLRRALRALVLADAGPGRHASGSCWRVWRYARPSLPAARLPAGRHHSAAADRLPVADLEHVAGLFPVLPAARLLDLRRRGGDLRQRHVHLAPRGGAAGEDQDGDRQGQSRGARCRGRWRRSPPHRRRSRRRASGRTGNSPAACCRSATGSRWAAAG